MTRTCSAVHTTAAVLVVTTLGIFAGTSSAVAGEPAEQQQGAQVLSEVQASKLSGNSLSSSQYQHVGQYLMSRAFASAQAYEAMDSLMDHIMGQAASDRMYTYLGERYLGKNVRPNSGDALFYARMATMMGSYGGHSEPYAGMMGAYLDGKGAPTSLGGYMMGGGMMGHGYSSSGSWPAGAIVAVAVLGALLIGGLLALALPRMRGRGSGRHPTRASPGS
jgi:hypothetical protein